MAHLSAKKVRPTSVSDTFRRLRQPHGLRGGPAAEVVAWGTLAPRRRQQCQAWLIVDQSDQLARWRKSLRARLSADNSWKTDERISRLAGHGLQFLALDDLGLSVVEEIADDDEEHPRYLFSRVSLGAILVDEKDCAIGYATFLLKWSVAQRPKSRPELEVEVHEVWISPKRRGEGLSTLLATAVVTGVWRQLDLLEASWPTTCPVKFDLVYAGDVYSTSGESFVETCCMEHQFWLDIRLERELLVERRVEYETRW